MTGARAARHIEGDRVKHRRSNVPRQFLSWGLCLDQLEARKGLVHWHRHSACIAVSSSHCHLHVLIVRFLAQPTLEINASTVPAGSAPLLLA